jgi:hypothetical protein
VSQPATRGAGPIYGADRARARLPLIQPGRHPQFAADMARKLTCTASSPRTGNDLAKRTQSGLLVGKTYVLVRNAEVTAKPVRRRECNGELQIYLPYSATTGGMGFQ